MRILLGADRRSEDTVERPTPDTLAHRDALSHRNSVSHIAASRGIVWPAVSSSVFVAFVTLTLIVAATGGQDAFDRAVLATAGSLRTTALTAVARTLTDLGAVPVVIVLACLVAALLWRLTRSWTLPALQLGAVAFTGGTVFLIKLAVGRARPPVTRLIGTPSTDYAYPSGHTSDGGVVLLTSAGLLGLVVTRAAVRRLLLTLAVVLAVGIGATRVYLGYHWATDVIGGWLLATAVATATCAVAKRLTGLPRAGPPS